METRELTFDTSGRRVVDVTRDVAGFAQEASGDGLLHLFLLHATAGLALMETGAGSEGDLEEVLGRILPRDDRWRHSHGATGHGGDHLLPVFVSPSLSVPVEDGGLVLGTWQSIVIVDPNRDNDRRRLRCSLLRFA